MSCNKFKNEVLELKAQGKTIAEISRELGRHRNSVTRHFSDRRREWDREKRSALKFEVDNYKVSKGCHMCSESDPRVLQFHHTNSEDKEFGIARLVSIGASLKKVFAEIEKCEVVCANCHLKIHNEIS